MKKNLKQFLLINQFTPS